MLHTAGKFIAVILAIWLPLFSGNTLAVSIAMQAMGGDCHSAVAQQGEARPHCASTVQQHAQHEQLAAGQGQSAGHPDQQNQHQQNQHQQNPAGEDCGTCHHACCSYLAAASIEVTEAQPSAGLYSLVSTQFQSITSTPLDPPPLACA
jgi:bacterioferritin-associated ferredoxin